MPINLRNPRIFLASRSPRRRELLTQVGIQFDTIVFRDHPREDVEVDETPFAGEVPLDFSYRLDDAPRFERFFLVSGSSRFSVEWFRKRLAAESISRDLALEKLPETALAALSDALPAGVHITEILLRK